MRYKFSCTTIKKVQCTIVRSSIFKRLFRLNHESLHRSFTTTFDSFDNENHLSRDHCSLIFLKLILVDSRKNRWRNYKEIQSTRNGIASIANRYGSQGLFFASLFQRSNVDYSHCLREVLSELCVVAGGLYQDWRLFVEKRYPYLIRISYNY